MLKYIIVILCLCQLLIYTPTLAEVADTDATNTKYYLTPQRDSQVTSYDQFDYEPVEESLLKDWWTPSLESFGQKKEELAMSPSDKVVNSKTKIKSKQKKFKTMKKGFKSEKTLRNEPNRNEESVKSYDRLYRYESFDESVNHQPVDRGVEVLGENNEQHAMLPIKYADKYQYETLTDDNTDPEVEQNWMRIVKHVHEAPPAAAYLRSYKKTISKEKQKIADLEVPRMPRP